MTEPTLPRSATPSPSLLGNLRGELTSGPPFSLMTPAHVDLFLAGAHQAYFAPGEVVMEPASGPVRSLLCIRRGSVTGRRGLAEVAGQFEYGAGDLFPIGAVLGHRAVTATYVANEDTFCLLLPAERVQELAAASTPFADFLNRRVMQMLDLSRRALQSAWSSRALAEQSLEARLASLPRKQPLTCAVSTPLADALQQMHDRHVGSIVVVDAQGRPLGILTRHDVLGRVTLPQRPLSTPIRDVMNAPLHTLTAEHTLQDAALLMSRHGVRHVPVTDQGRLVNIVSERDLFALQRQSLNQLSAQLQRAGDLATLQQLAAQIRAFARNLLGQGVQARQLTELVSHLNDLLTERIVVLVAQRRGMDLSRACWLLFGSEGRSEQTIATDQDNGLVYEGDDAVAGRSRWLALAREVNDQLDACGYPLCKGGVMAGNPDCCLTAPEWLQRFTGWIERGAPEDLLMASIFFDLRPLCGNSALAQPMRDLLSSAATGVPRFLRQMADNALRNRPPLSWRGSLETQDHDGRPMVDLKLHGTAIFVDAARLYALAHHVPALGTRARLDSAAPLMRLPAQEAEAWVAAFEFLQLLRLQVQIGAAAAPGNHPNRVDPSELNEIERRMLKESMRIARRVQQRIELDYQR
jgi:CBS domain-containing protein